MNDGSEHRQYTERYLFFDNKFIEIKSIHGIISLNVVSEHGQYSERNVFSDKSFQRENPRWINEQYLP